MINLRICSILQLLFFRVHGSNSSHNPLWQRVPADCGKTRADISMRIIGGQDAELGQFPWMAEIGKFGSSRRSIFFFCGGSLITRFYVLSAAHCEDDGEIVRLGEHNMKTYVDCDRFGVCAPPYQDIKIKKFKFLDYDKTLYYNDLSLIELQDPVKFNEFVQPVCLPYDPIDYSKILNHVVKIAGWGAVNARDTTVATTLKYVALPVVEKEECAKLYRRIIRDNQLCIGYKHGGKDSCAGDSGGPATKEIVINESRRSFLIGVISFGLVLCGKDVAVYTDVSRHTEWILKEIERI